MGKNFVMQTAVLAAVLLYAVGCGRNEPAKTQVPAVAEEPVYEWEQYPDGPYLYGGVKPT